MKVKRISVTIRFTTPILGSHPRDEDIFKRFINENAPEELRDSELEIFQSQEDMEVVQGKTYFPRNKDGYICVMDYQIRGFLKESGNCLKDQIKIKKKGIDGSLTAIKSKIDKFVFVSPRYITILPATKEVNDTLERPLRAQTAMGPRVCLASSEMLNVEDSDGNELDITAEFTIEILENREITPEIIREFLGYGRFAGLGQWRNGSYGRFEVIKFKELGDVTM